MSQTSEIFKSEEEILKTIKTRVNPLVPKHVQNLWDAILEYGIAKWEVGGEGNSGEFHDEREELRLENELKTAEKKLTEQFSLVTGYLPNKLSLTTDERTFSFRGHDGRILYLVIEHIWELKKID